jgi:hypothetical protein
MKIKIRPATLIARDDGRVEVHRECQVTGEVFILIVDAQALIDWREGKLIQDAFPQLTKDQREILMTGFTPAEWDAMPSWDDEEEDDATGTDP